MNQVLVMSRDGQYTTALGPNLGIWILIGYNSNLAVILRFGEIQITRQIAQISKSIKAYKTYGTEIFETPNLNITAKLKLYPIKIHIPKLGPKQ